MTTHENPKLDDNGHDRALDIAYDCCFTETYVEPSARTSPIAETITCAGKIHLFSVAGDGHVELTLRDPDSDTGWSAPKKLKFKDHNGDTVDPSDAGQVVAISASSVDDGRAAVMVSTDKKNTYFGANSSTTPTLDDWGNIFHLDTLRSHETTRVQAIASGSIPVTNSEAGNVMWFAVQRSESDSNPNSTAFYRFDYFANHGSKAVEGGMKQSSINSGFSYYTTNNRWGYLRGGGTGNPLDIYGQVTNFQKKYIRKDWGVGKIVASRDGSSTPGLVFAYTGLLDDGSKNVQFVWTAVAGKGQNKWNDDSDGSDKNGPFFTMQQVAGGNVKLKTSDSHHNFNAVLAADLCCVPRSGSSKHAISLAFFAGKIGRPDNPNQNALYNAVNIQFLTNQTGDSDTNNSGSSVNLGVVRHIGTVADGSAMYPSCLKVSQVVDTAASKQAITYPETTEASATASQSSSGGSAYRMSRGFVAMLSGQERPKGASSSSQYKTFSGYIGTTNLTATDSDEYNYDGVDPSDRPDGGGNPSTYLLPSFAALTESPSGIACVQAASNGHQLTSGVGGDEVFFTTATAQRNKSKHLSGMLLWECSSPESGRFYPEPILEDTSDTDQNDVRSISVYSVQFGPSAVSKLPLVDQKLDQEHDNAKGASDDAGSQDPKKHENFDSAPVIWIRPSETTDCLIDGKITYLLSGVWHEIPAVGVLAIPSDDLSCPLLDVAIPGSPDYTTDSPALIAPSAGVSHILADVSEGSLEHPTDRYGKAIDPVLAAGGNDTEGNRTCCAQISNDLARSMIADTTSNPRGQFVSPKPSTSGDDEGTFSYDASAELYSVSFTRPCAPEGYPNNMRVDASMTVKTRERFYADLVEKLESHEPLTDAAMLGSALDGTSLPAENESVAYFQDWLDTHEAMVGSSDLLSRMKEFFQRASTLAYSAIHAMIHAGELFIEEYQIDNKARAMYITLRDSKGAKYLHQIVDWTVSQAMCVLSDIYATMKVAYETLTEWLSWLFNWTNINNAAGMLTSFLESTEQVFQSAVHASFDKVVTLIEAVKDHVNQAFDHVEEKPFANTSINDLNHDFFNGNGLSGGVLPDSGAVGGHNPFFSSNNISRGTITAYDGRYVDEGNYISSEEMVAAFSGVLNPEKLGVASRDVVDFLKGFDLNDVFDVTLADLLEPLRKLVILLFDAVEDLTLGLENTVSKALHRFYGYGSSEIYIPVLTPLLKQYGPEEFRTLTPFKLVAYMMAVPMASAAAIAGTAGIFSQEALENFSAELNENIDYMCAWLEGDSATAEFNPPRWQARAEAEDDEGFSTFETIMHFIGLGKDIVTFFLAYNNLPSRETFRDSRMTLFGAAPMQRYLLKPLSVHPDRAGIFDSTFFNWAGMSMSCFDAVTTWPGWHNNGESPTTGQTAVWVYQLISEPIANLLCITTQGNPCNAVQCHPVYFSVVFGSASRMISLVNSAKTAYENDGSDAKHAYDVLDSIQRSIYVVGGIANIINTLSPIDVEDEAVMGQYQAEPNVFYLGLPPVGVISWEAMSEGALEEAVRFKANQYMLTGLAAAGLAMQAGKTVALGFALAE